MLGNRFIAYGKTVFQHPFASLAIQPEWETVHNKHPINASRPAFTDKNKRILRLGDG